MRLLGINKGWTCTAKMLRNGGAAAYLDGHIVAISEERVTGRKYAPGYSCALSALLRTQGLSLDGFDLIGISTCCEPQHLALRGHELEGHPRLQAINHHLSHAALAFYSSGFDRALVVVIDGGGNVLADDGGQLSYEDWWSYPREQHSYYLATRQGLELVGRDFDEPYAIGMGEMYRAFTYYLGWPSSTNSSKTMALAGHGRRGAIKGDLFVSEHGRFISHIIKNNPPDPICMVTELAHVLDVDFGEPRSPGSAILQIHKDVAAFVQDQCERALSQRLAALKWELKVDSLCIAGGFGLNVVANGSLLSKFPGGVYVPSAPRRRWSVSRQRFRACSTKETREGYACQYKEFGCLLGRRQQGRLQDCRLRSG